MAALISDLRVALRSLSTARGFAATAVLTLGLGIALSTTAAAVVNAYLLRDLPYPAASRLFWIRYDRPGVNSPRNMETLDWASLQDVIEHPVAWDLDVFSVLGDEHADSIPGAWVTPGFIEALGIQPALGRGFDADAFGPGGANVALISNRLWSTRFSRDPGIIGRTFTAYVSDRPNEAERFTIVGVLPAGFWHFNPFTDILAPLRGPTFPYMARLRSGVTAERAAERVTALVSSGARDVPAGWGARLVSSHEAYVESLRPMLRAVTLAAALVLLVACGNVAGLLLVRATRRQKELAVRAALGAGRGAITRLLFAEALLLGTGAVLLGLGASRLVLSGLSALVQQQLGRPAPGGENSLTIDPGMAALAVGLGLTTVLICTLAQLATGRSDVHHALSQASRGATEGRRSRRLRSALIAIEIAVSLTLLTGATLMLRTTFRLLTTELGMDATHVLNASVTLRQNRYPDANARAALFSRMVSRLEAVPSVESVGLTTARPVQQPQLQKLAALTGAARQPTRAAVHGVSGRYFETLRIPVREGRTFEDRDRMGAEPVVVVSQSLARRVWPGGGALGHRLSVPQQQERGTPVLVDRLIVGIVADVRQEPSDTELADAYVPLLQAPSGFAFVLIRTAGSPVAELAAIQSSFRDIDSEIALMRAGPLQDGVDALVRAPAFLRPCSPRSQQSPGCWRWWAFTA